MKFEDQEIVFRCNHPLIESVTINFVYNRQDFSPHRFFVTGVYPPFTPLAIFPRFLHGTTNCVLHSPLPPAAIVDLQTENFPIQCDPNVNFTFIWQAPVEVTTGEELYAVTIQDSIGLADGLSGLVDIDGISVPWCFGKKMCVFFVHKLPYSWKSPHAEPVIEVLTPTESASILANASVPIRWTCNRIVELSCVLCSQ